MIKQYVYLSSQLAQLFNAKSEEKNLDCETFYENQELETRIFYEYLHIFGLLLTKNFYYTSK